MEKISRNKLLLYALISAVSFIYLIMPDRAGLSVTLFVILQFACWFYLAPNKKPLWLFAPILILALNSFISGNSIWHESNFFVITALYSVMVLLMIGKFRIKEDSLRFILDTAVNIIAPVEHFFLPLKWWSEADQSTSAIVKRVLKGIAVTLPCLVILVLLLSSADAVFLAGAERFFRPLSHIMSLATVLKVICGAAVGMYLFGLMYIAYTADREEEPREAKERNGDLTIINILLISILAVYTLFVFIQFRYLFAGAELPYGLSYTEYARKGFFELLFLSGVNILLILITVNLTRFKEGLWGRITKFLNGYLCAVTLVLLASSFYRMWLYSADAGLTRLRLLVFGFLIFEAIGLLITFFYIKKPNFNIAGVYLGIGLLYYLLLNVVPIDSLIAKNQIDRYFNHHPQGIEYIMTLSPDAAPQINRLLTNDEVDIHTRQLARTYFDRLEAGYGGAGQDWREYNLSIAKGLKLEAETPAHF